MRRSKGDDTEVVKLRISSNTKDKLMRVAEKECRTFSAQVRMILDQWSEKTK